MTDWARILHWSETQDGETESAAQAEGRLDGSGRWGWTPDFSAATRSTEGVTGYSVRPDLWWPPGQEVRGPDGVALVEWHRTTSAWILRNWADRAEDQCLGDPGVAEALVLAGQVSRAPDWASLDRTSPDLWTSCPRPEGSQ